MQCLHFNVHYAMSATLEKYFIVAKFFPAQDFYIINDAKKDDFNYESTTEAIFEDMVKIFYFCNGHYTKNYSVAMQKHLLHDLKKQHLTAQWCQTCFKTSSSGCPAVPYYKGDLVYENDK